MRRTGLYAPGGFPSRLKEASRPYGDDPSREGKVLRAAGFARIFEEEAACGPRAVKAKPMRAPAWRVPGLPPPDQDLFRADRVIPLIPAVGLDRRTPAHWRGPSRLHAQPDFKEKPKNSDLYQSVTDCNVSRLEQGVRPWMQPWSAERAAGRITRPLRANGVAYQGINVLVLWGEAITKG